MSDLRYTAVIGPSQRLDPPEPPAVFGVHFTIADPQPWQEAVIDGRTLHHDPLCGWQPGPAPEPHHRTCRQRTDAEHAALANHALKGIL